MGYVLDKGAEALGLNEEQKDVLFDAFPEDEWPHPFGDAYAKAKTPAGRARAAARSVGEGH